MLSAGFAKSIGDATIKPQIPTFLQQPPHHLWDSVNHGCYIANFKMMALNITGQGNILIQLQNR
jgi:hypothetical protein